jgi:hypothetical protein
MWHPGVGPFSHSSPCDGPRRTANPKAAPVRHWPSLGSLCRRQTTRWPADLTLSFNLSRVQLRGTRPGLAAWSIERCQKDNSSADPFTNLGLDRGGPSQIPFTQLRTTRTWRLISGRQPGCAYLALELAGPTSECFDTPRGHHTAVRVKPRGQGRDKVTFALAR